MKITLIAASFIAVFSSSLFVMAVPYTLAPPRVLEETYSLANIKAFSVEVQSEDLPGITDEVTNQIIDRLADAEYEIVNDPEVPRLVLHISTAMDPQQPDGLALAMIVAVHQPISVERLESTLVVPTFTSSHIKLTTHGDVKKVVLRQCPRLMDFMIELMSKATASWKNKQPLYERR